MNVKDVRLPNPFLIMGYYSEEYFCDRKEETKRMLSAISNGRNMTLMSVRRMGKTGLIQHIFNPAISGIEYKTIYLDIYPTTSLSDFVKVFAKAVMVGLESKTERFFEKALQFFRSIRPVVSFNPLTGIPEIEISAINEQKPDESLGEIFAYLASVNQPVVIAIDEFQQISYYPEKNVEALLRSYIQQTTSVRFIFSGSEKHLLQNMFTDTRRPFYQSAELLYLEPIAREEYIGFASDCFEKVGRKIGKEQLKLVYDELYGHTWYVQFMMNRIYSLSDIEVNEQIIKDMLIQVVLENEPIYHSYRKMLTSLQWQVLKAIAKERKVSNPTSKVFINKYSLGSASSVQTVFKALLDKELIYEADGEYLVYDRFFSKWLEMN